ncbi:ciliogenesis-associated TTC17-interacting protein-like [Corticium candelabrum]|uniref:ciliogenesis-associated TTC17-interacting protein-like n=1 Tax=Corticium candelabrum TaxID=121492 RepID=UPI002E26399F|nr:ciliogenesis-associated TTC17-interacting protein-like [Corticium candelabrum]
MAEADADNNGRVVCAAPDAVNFLSSLTEGDEIIPQLLFSETLCAKVGGKAHQHINVNVSLGGTPDGSNFYNVMITRVKPTSKSDGTVQTITTTVASNLQVLEEKYVTTYDDGREMKLALSQRDDKYHMTKTVQIGQESVITVKSFSISSMSGFVSEGSSFLLQRVMALQHRSFSLPLEFVGLDYEAFELCRLIYRQESVTGDSQPCQYVKHYDRADRLSLVYKCILDDGGRLTFYGLLGATGSEADSDMDALPQQTTDAEDLPAVDVMSLPGSLHWEDDMEMFSQYLDRKEELKEIHAVYMREHPELKAILADFLQFLLIRKPDDVTAFAADFFASYSARAAPSGGFASSGSTSAFQK